MTGRATAWSAPVPYAGRFEIQNDHRRVAIVDSIHDAHLVASAPELLDVLKKAQQVIRQHIPNNEPVCVPGICSFIDAAIEKAEGYPIEVKK